MVADSVGLGKTWIGKKLLEDFAYHMRQKALVVCPASLREIWEHELAEATIPATVLSQEELGQEEFDPSPWADADVVLVDESHNFRNQNAQRYGNMERLLGANGGRGRDGGRKKVILLTATPINNDLFDLYNQFCLITRGDRSYFSACGIGDLYRYFLKARRDSRANSGVFALFNLLEEIVIRRTRPFIRTAYPEATIKGQRIHFPQRKLKTVRYDLENTYAGIYDEIVSGIESLQLAPYNLEAYKKVGVEVDTFEAGREQALVEERNEARQYRIALSMLAWLKAEVVWMLALIVWATVRVALGKAEGLGVLFTPGVIAVVGTTVAVHLVLSYRAR